MSMSLILQIDINSHKFFTIKSSIKSMYDARFSTEKKIFTKTAKRN